MNLLRCDECCNVLDGIDDVDCYSLGFNNIPYGLYRKIISDIKIIDTIQENKLGLIK